MRPSSRDDGRIVMLSSACTAALMEQAAQRWHEAAQRAVEMVHYSGKARLAHHLGRLAAAETHAEMGAWLGMSLAEVTKALAHLRDGGLIDYQPHQRGLVVIDRQGLLDLDA